MSSVLAFDYVLTDKDGKVIDASQEGKPLVFITGLGQIIPGLETVLSAMTVNEQKTVTVKAGEAYGIYDKALVYQVDRSKLPSAEIKIGDMFEAGEGEQFTPVTITAIENDAVTLDGNHPLAGQDLTFAVVLRVKREATSEELAHGHVHGMGGCGH